MNSRQIEIFHTVMLMGTVTEAATKLGITQPAVTASLKQIEGTLGFMLFHRAGGRLHPTAEAQVLFSEAERIQDNLEVFRKLAVRLKNDLTAHLRIAVPPVFSLDLIPDTIASFIAETSSCMIDVTTQHHDQILADIASAVGHNNLGITFGLEHSKSSTKTKRSEEKLSMAGLGSIPIGSAQIVALIPASWPLARKPRISVSDFRDKPMVGTFTGEPLGNAVENMLKNSGISNDFSVRVHNHSVAANLASKGVGAAFIDSVTAAYAQRYYGEKTFKVRAIQQAPSLSVTAVFAYAHPLNAHAKRFIDIFRKHFKALYP
jgi:DNA-binding transcriptional LysR family regulator